MSVKMSERDLAALRAGIEEQVRRDVRFQIWQQNWDRKTAKRHVYHAKVITASELKEGDVICSTHGIRFFQAEEVVEKLHYGTHNGQPIAGDIWIETPLGGSSLRYDNPVLIEVA